MNEIVTRYSFSKLPFVRLTSQRWNFLGFRNLRFRWKSCNMVCMRYAEFIYLIVQRNQSFLPCRSGNKFLLRSEFGFHMQTIKTPQSDIRKSRRCSKWASEVGLTICRCRPSKTFWPPASALAMRIRQLLSLPNLISFCSKWKLLQNLHLLALHFLHFVDQKQRLGPVHRTAGRLAAFFEDIVPSTPNLVAAYGKRASGIISRPHINPQESAKDGPFRSFASADKTAIGFGYVG